MILKKVCADKWQLLISLLIGRFACADYTHVAREQSAMDVNFMTHKCHTVS